MPDQSQQQPAHDVDGYDRITSALLALLNQYPALQTGDKIKFADLDDTTGKAMVPSAGSVIVRERSFIGGLIQQHCSYPFTVYYRASNATPARRQAMQEWLDQLGRWLERQPISIGEVVHKLTAYPDIADGRKIIDIRRTAPAGCGGVLENGAEDWTISLQLNYLYEFHNTTL